MSIEFYTVHGVLRDKVAGCRATDVNKFTEYEEARAAFRGLIFHYKHKKVTLVVWTDGVQKVLAEYIEHD